MKRALDLLLTIGSAPLWLPLGLMVALLVRMQLGTPIFFRQPRPGWGGRAFELVKFRTMVMATDAEGDLLPDSQRLTRFGRMLRATSLDELPELWNVVRGDMSLVGPRPLLQEYMPLYSAGQARRHELRPGITGWAQVNGRNAIAWDERLALDVWYVDNRTIWLDVKILAMTALRVVRREGISEAGEVTMSKFMGTRR